MGVDVSVVVPFHNVGEHIGACIRALLSQHYPEHRYEIIMVDNNSTDESSEIVQRYSRVKCLAERKKGPYAARNRAVAEATGAIVAFTDSDCVARKDWLQEISKAMQAPEVGIVLGNRTFATDSPILSGLAAYESEVAARTFTDKRTEAYYGYANNMAVRRELFDSLGPFLEMIRGADNVFVQRAVETHGGNVVRFVPAVSVRHLEIAGVRDYLRKKHIYGRVNWDIREVGSPEALTLSKRFQSFRSAARRTAGPPGSAVLLLLLGIGAACFALGRWGAILKSWNGLE